MDKSAFTPLEAMKRIADSKLEQRRALARLSFEEKFRLVAEMNQLGSQAPPVFTNLGTYLVMAEESLAESQKIGTEQREPRAGGGEVVTFDPARRSFKLSLITIAFAGMYLEALLYLYGHKALGADEYSGIDFSGYEEKLYRFGIRDQALLDAARKFRQIRNELVHEKAYAQTELRMAQDEAQKAVDLIHRVRLALSPRKSSSTE